MRLRFDLRANPVVAGHNEQGKHVRHDVVMQAKTKAAARVGSGTGMTGTAMTSRRCRT